MKTRNHLLDPKMGDEFNVAGELHDIGLILASGSVTVRRFPNGKQENFYWQTFKPAAYAERYKDSQVIKLA